MIFIRLVVAVSLCSTFATTRAETKLVAKKKKVCKFTESEHNRENSTFETRKIKQGKRCKEFCLDDKFKDKCLGFQQEGDMCYLLENPVQGFKSPPKDKNPNDFTCGMIPQPKVTESPTSAPTDSPTVPISFIIKNGAICKPNKKNRGWEKTFDVTGDKCMSKCVRRSSCVAYSWFEKKGECTIYDNRPGMLRNVKDNSFCARVPAPTPSPTESPTTAPPTKAPTEPPTDSPTKAPVEPPIKCIIEATLGFDFVNPDAAPYYGQHLDWIEVMKESNEDEICSAYYENHETVPTWCKYKNSKKGHDGAHVDNYEDYYYDEDELKNELATRETVTIKKAEDEETIIKVYHWLFATDYYPTAPTWNDHMMAPKLKIMNRSENKQEQIGRDYQHPVSKYVRTHIKKNGKWVGNPNYEGNFQVKIKCNKKCFCEDYGYKHWNGFETGRTGDGAGDLSATRTPRRRTH